MTITQQAGWYTDHTGQSRWWDGQAWGPYAPQPVAQQPQWDGPRPWENQSSHGPMTHSALKVRREVIYNRAQAGHSLTKWLVSIIYTAGISIIGIVYISVSPNHYWRA